MKVVIAYDGSEAACDMLFELRHAGLPADTHALVLSVSEELYAPVDAHGKPMDAKALSDQATARGLADEGREHLRKIFPDWSIDIEGTEGSPASVIVQRAATWGKGDPHGADLIVVGSSGLGRIERFVFGSVSQHVLASAPCSVRVCRGNPDRDRDPVRLVIAHDGSSDADAAIDAMIARSWNEGTSAILVTALPSMFAGGVERWEKDEIEDLHAEVVGRLETGGIATTSLIEQISPKRLLVDCAEKNDADCIVMGARGRTRFERMMLGSVSSAVAARAHCSVEVVRPVVEG